MSGCEKLRTWKRAHALVLRVYELTRSFPASERTGLGASLRGAAISIATRLAEGCARRDDEALARSARMARVAANQLHYLTRVAVDVQLVSAIEATRLFASVDEVCRLLDALVARLGRDLAARDGSRRRRATAPAARASRSVPPPIEPRGAPPISRR
jgi:four helix bundle protein